MERDVVCVCVCVPGGRESLIFSGSSGLGSGSVNIQSQSQYSEINESQKSAFFNSNTRHIGDKEGIFSRLGLFCQGILRNGRLLPTRSV